MKQAKNRSIPQTKILNIWKMFPRKSRDRRFIHQFLVSDQEQLRINRQIENSAHGRE